MRALRGTRRTLTTIEHDAGFAGFLNAALQAEALGDNVTVLHAPLAKYRGGTREWYDVRSFESLGDQRFDLIIVDGPPAYGRDSACSREFTADVVDSRLAERFSVFVDDTDRDSERALLRRWAARRAVHAANFPIRGGFGMFQSPGARYCVF